MKRALIAAAAVVLAAGALFWVQSRDGQPGGGADGPIILISIDTLRADRLPAYGYTGVKTPNIDRLAADGVVFDRAWAHSPLTLPSHTSILSGALPFEHGVRDNIGFTVKDGARLLPHALRERGYATGGFVSSYVLRRQTGIHQGFDHYDDTLPPAAPDRPLGQVQRPGDQTVAAAIRWIDGLPSSKFFAFVHLYEPHLPYTPPPRHAGGHPYDGEIAYADEIVGTLLEHLRAKQLYERATIVLLSDHGEGLGDHGEEEHGIFLYRETIQVPLMVKLPGARRGGSRAAPAVQQIDLLPTILSLAGAPSASDARGRSLVPVLDGTGSLAPASLYAESLSPRYHFGWSELYALSDDRYRLIRAPRDELYDLDQDPRELRSIAAERPQVHAAMRGALDQMTAGAAVTAPSAVSDEDRNRLAALGYVGTQRSAIKEPGAGGLPDPKDKIDVLRRYKRASQLAGEGQAAQAIAEYRALLAVEPAMTDVWLQLAGVYERAGAFADSLAAYQAVIRQSPKDPAALMGAASALVHLGRLDDARKHAELATDTAPATANELLARIAVNAGDAAAARAHAQRAADADPTLPMPAIVEGALRYRAGDFRGAADSLGAARRAMQARTEQVPDVHYYLGDALARLERYAEAEPMLRQEVQLFPHNVRARAALAMLYRAMGRVADSDRAVAELIRTNPTAQGFDTASKLWSMFGDPARADEMAARARTAR